MIDITERAAQIGRLILAAVEVAQSARINTRRVPGIKSEAHDEHQVIDYVISAGTIRRLRQAIKKLED